MNRQRIFIVAAATLSATLWAYACGDGATDPPTPPPDPPRPTTVTVSPATAELGALGATVQLSAEVRDQNGQAMAGATVSWASDNAPVATVDGSGLVTAAGNGTATITATAGSARGTAEIKIRGCPNGSWRLWWLLMDSCYAATSFPSTGGVPSWFRWALSIQRSL